MTLVDVNVLIYAVNHSAPQHRAAKGWWERALASDETIAVSWAVLSGFVRIVTNRRGFGGSIRRESAIEFVTEWLNEPRIELIAPTKDHWLLFEALLEESGAIGNLVTDAHLAAIAIGNGAALASCDADFARFSKLRWVNPLAAG